jgi:hypothetical protein
MIKKLLYISLLILPLVCIAQSSRQKGQVFKTRPDYPMENLDKSGEIVVTRTMYRLVFEDDAIPDAYKKMVGRFFNQVFYNEYKKIGVQYYLKVEKRAFGDIYIENQKVGNIKEIPTSK